MLASVGTRSSRRCSPPLGRDHPSCMGSKVLPAPPSSVEPAAGGAWRKLPWLWPTATEPHKQATASRAPPKIMGNEHEVGEGAGLCTWAWDSGWAQQPPGSPAWPPSQVEGRGEGEGTKPRTPLPCKLPGPLSSCHGNTGGLAGGASPAATTSPPLPPSLWRFLLHPVNSQGVLQGSPTPDCVEVQVQANIFQPPLPAIPTNRKHQGEGDVPCADTEPAPTAPVPRLLEVKARPGWAQPGAEYPATRWGPS